MKNLYIVPYDFTNTSDIALNYALHICKKVEAEVRILHLISSKRFLNTAKERLENRVAKLDVPSKAKITFHIEEGNIFEDIGRISTDFRAQLIIMGTHGRRGWAQKIFGSHAIKIVTSCNIPFLIVQKGFVPKTVKNIVVPIDLSKESMQIVSIAGGIATIYDSVVHVLGPKQQDELMTQRMKNRVSIIQTEYENRGVKTEIKLLEEGGSYSNKIIKYVKSHGVDMIAFAYHTEALFPQLNSFAQNLITNKDRLPCLVIQSKEASSLYF